MTAMSVITPTCGRGTLAHTVASVAPQLEPGDELIVVGDGHQPWAARLCRQARTRGRIEYAELAVPQSTFGNGQRDHGLRLASGSHVCFLDDDDVYRDGALASFREAAQASARAVHVFKAEWGPGHHAAGTVLWREPLFVESNIGTPMVVWPRSTGLPTWMDFNALGVVSDFGWMSAALGLRRLCWHDEIVATVRPQ